MELKSADMAATIEQLQKRVAALEQEVADLRQRLADRWPVNETPAERAARMIRQSRESHPALVAGWKTAMEEMGIKGEPVGAERLQEMMLEGGIKPEDNVFSRGIIEAREE